MMGRTVWWLSVWFVGVLFLVASSMLWAADFSFDFNEVRLVDLTRLVLSDVLNASYAIEPELLQDNTTVSLRVRHVEKQVAVDLLHDTLKRHGYVVEVQGRVLLVRKSPEESNEDLLVYHPRFRSAKYLSDVMAGVVGEKTTTARMVSAETSNDTAHQASPIGDKPGTVGALVNKNDVDQLTYKCRPERCRVLQSLLERVDTPISQVLLRAAVYEVTTTKSEGSALQLALRLFHGKLTFASVPAPAGNVAQFVNGDISAIASVLDTDTHFKSLSKPFVQVVTGAQARFEVGSQVPVLGAVTQAGNGNTMQSVDYRNSGTILTVTPDIRGDVISLQVSQELSNFIATTNGVNNSPTLTIRKATSQLLLKSGDVAVMAGLEGAQDTDSRSGLFGLTLQKAVSATSQEVLVFIEAERI